MFADDHRNARHGGEQFRQTFQQCAAAGDTTPFS
jgi:hypothetical protein